MVIKVGINGFGRIGRVIFRTCLQNPGIELSAINDPAIDIEYICYLIKFDSTHGKFKGNITHIENTINIDGRLIIVFREKLPHTVPWQVAGVQYVVEASGMFTGLEKSSGHLASDGVKRVIVTAPSVDVPMIILGVNDNQLHAEQKVLSCASSTLYCLAPIVKVLEDNFGVSDGFITSIHAMTPSLKPLDGLCLRGKHWRDHRSIHQNIIPATTGSCKALAKIIPQVKDKMAGLAFRVPIVNVSVLDMTIRLDTNTSLQDIINSVETAGRTYLRNIIKITNEEAVSSDFIGDSHSCILDAASSLQLKPNFYKIICWYENEFSYACRVIDSIFFSERQFNSPVRLPSKMTYVRAKLTKKQDEVQQTERNLKETCSTECNTEVPKCTTSAQDNMYLRRPPVRPVVLRRPPSPHISGIPVTEPAVPRDSKKSNELFKIWNDKNDAQKIAARQKRSSFFNSCMAFGPKQAENAADCMKAQERLENVKKEFSKMVNITEDLLKQSNADKLQLGTPQKSCLLGVKLSANGESIDSKIPIRNNSPTDNSIFGLCSNKNGSSDNSTDCSNKAVRRCSSGDRNENNSEYKITSAVKKIVINKPYLIPSREKIAGLAKQNTITNVGRKVTIENKLSAKAHDSMKINSKYNINMNIKPHMTINDNNFMDSLSNKSPVRCAMKDQKKSPIHSDSAIKQNMEEKQMEFKITEPQVKFEKQLSQKQELNPPEEIPHKDLDQYLQKKDYNMRIIDEALQKRNMILVNNEKSNNSELSGKTSNISSEQMIAETEVRGKTINKQILETLDSRDPGPVVVVPVERPRCVNSHQTANTNSNWNCTRKKLDLYEKLDSASTTNSTNSFEVNEKKSQILQIYDLSNSIEDLTRLDKICRIIEISDELSDKLFSSLDHKEITGLQHKSWSFRDLCERIQLDDFCNKVFGKSRS